MPKRKPSRSRRKAGRRQPTPHVAAAPSRPVAAPVAVAAPGTAPAAPEPAPERSATHFHTRDYAYVRREVGRIVVLATAILIAIVVLSFFLP